MVECYNENIWYVKRKRNRSKKKRFFKFFVFISIVVSVFLYYKFIVAKNVTKIVADYAYSYSTESVNSAVINCLKEQFIYEEVISVSKNSSGDITLISANPVKVNSVGSQLVKETEKILTNKLKNGVQIPLFAFSGLKFLSGLGNKISFKALSIVSVEFNLNDKFQSVGINQTLHSIYYDITCSIKIDAPAEYKVEEYTTSVLVSEALLVGKVPEIYMNGN